MAFVSVEILMVQVATVVAVVIVSVILVMLVTVSIIIVICVTTVTSAVASVQSRLGCFQIGFISLPSFSGSQCSCNGSDAEEQSQANLLA